MPSLGRARRAGEMITFYILLLLLIFNLAGSGERLWQRHKRLKPQIIGGSDARPGVWPWQVSVQKGRKHVCGGSILDNCADHLSVEMGTINLTHQAGQRHRVAEVRVHPDFNFSVFEADVALLQVKDAITFSDSQEPVLLPPGTEAKSTFWAPCFVIGWGVTWKERRPAILQEVEVEMVDWQRCQSWMPGLTQNMLCAGFVEGGRDACQGDSGGPLMCQGPESESWIQIGIVSWGKGCGEPQRPGVYTMLSKYIDWIQNTTSLAGRPYTVRQANSTKSSTEAPDLNSPAKRSLIFGRQADTSTNSGTCRGRAFLSIVIWRILIKIIDK
ncbi:serine protease 55-like isoform X2 [Narcine bancroftii]|uniref:serine protease 55-like isoform X2 n=1 Tax=Narcine bancroftii TaxID=1343680 RepID=UPI0038312C1D